jgi:hypothetical protein
VADLLLQRSRIDPRPVILGFVLDEVMRQVRLVVLHFFPVFIIPLLPYSSTIGSVHDLSK